MQDVFVVGDINVDVITEKFQSLEKKQQPLGVSMTKGGEAFNFACACSRLGLKTHFIGRAGKDLLGEFLCKKAKEFGLNRPIMKKGETGITIALTQKDRKFLTFRGENRNLCSKDIPKKINSKIFYLGGLWHLESLHKDLEKLFKKAKQTATTCLNIGFDYNNQKAMLDKILPHVDVFFLNDEELRQINKKPGEIIESGTNMVVVHKGSRGSELHYKGGVVKAKALAKKSEAKNPTGSGDIFNAAFIFSLLKGQSLENCLKFGNAAGALHAIRQEDFVPNHKEIMDFGGFKK